MARPAIQASPRAVALAMPAAVRATRNETRTQGPPEVDAAMVSEGNHSVTAPIARPMTRAARTPRADRTARPAFGGAAVRGKPSEMCAAEAPIPLGLIAAASVGSRAASWCFCAMRFLRHAEIEPWPA